MTFNEARNILAIMFYGTEEGKEINRILNEVDDSHWHTGTPTEEGLYVVIVQKYVFTENNRRVFLVEKKDPYFWIRDGKGHLEYGDVLAWIPYVEEGEE